ncbi:MAG: histidinol dehydrogenase, partial [Candidatus Azotimanducaceae bacterium]
MSVRQLDSADADFTQQLDGLLAWDLSTEGDVDQVVRKVISEVQAQGDAAILSLTEKFDHLTASTVLELEISQDEMRTAFERIDAEERIALERAAQRIRDYHQHQVQSSWSFTDEFGNQLGQRVQPLERVGVYVPGGQASYPSSVLMTLIPAKVAGVEELIVTVPTPSGIRNDMVLAALFVAGADRAFTIGGAQAVAALAYGTETIPKVDKIVGPGGAFVAAAKRLVFGQVGIDLIAGPSEICVVADQTANAEWIVWDLFSQAEHDADAQAILVSADQDILDQVDKLITNLL